MCAIAIFNVPKHSLTTYNSDHARALDVSMHETLLLRTATVRMRGEINCRSESLSSNDIQASTATSSPARSSISAELYGHKKRSLVPGTSGPMAEIPSQWSSKASPDASTTTPPRTPMWARRRSRSWTSRAHGA